jgi:hypothetical protein
MKVMFLDESGDHSLDKIDPQYPLFVLGGVILDRTYARTVVEPRLQELKKHFFEREDIILHTADIIRAKNGFERLKDAAVRSEFFEELNAMMRELDYKVIACVVRKDMHLAKYKKNAVDPYMLSLEVLVERFCREIGTVLDGGMIYAEKRGPDLDDALERAWLDLQIKGTAYAHSEHICERIIDLSLRDKQLNNAGLQLADLVVSPIGRHVMGKPDREDWQIIEQKFRRASPTGSYLGYGLVVLPH